MIILDEQLLGRNLEGEIARWYPGSIYFVTDLRPNTIIKDDAIPTLLNHLNQSTFVTINESDFWRKVEITNRFAVVCFALPDVRAREIANYLRELFGYALFATKQKRMGKVIRVSNQNVTYYTVDDRSVRLVTR
jgi:hypothetical protein